MINGATIKLPNFGGAFKFGDFVFGVGYNRLADFNSQKQAVGDYEQFNSKARIWVDQLDGIPSANLNKTSTMFNYNPMIWNAIMGYDSYLIDAAADGADWYGLWNIIDAEDYIASSIKMVTNGAIDEYVISGAYNFGDKFYLGASMGFQRLYYTQRTTYEEFNYLPTAYGIFDNFYLNDWLSMDGFGFNLKVGATVRPVDWLRIGVAYHSPTWINMKEISNAEMMPYFTEGKGRYSYTPDLVQEYNMSTPCRLMAGISATLFKRMIVSFDYELTWYDQMKYTSTVNTSGWRPGMLSDDIDSYPVCDGYTSSRGDIALNNVVTDFYKPVNNYRIGVEITPVHGFFLRAGFAYSDSPYKNIRSYYDPGYTLNKFGATTRWSGGLGYRTGRFNVDLAYVYSTWNSLPSKFFDYVTSNAYDTGLDFTNGDPWIIPAGTEIMSEQNINTTNYNHNVLLTFSWRF